MPIDIFEVTCPACGLDFDVAADAEAAKCPHCFALMRLEEAPGPAAEKAPSEAAAAPAAAAPAPVEASAAEIEPAATLEEPGEAADAVAAVPEGPARRSVRGSFLSRTDRTPGDFTGIPVIDLEGVGPKFARKLNGIGIETTEQLLWADAHKVAERAGIRRTDVRKWQDMSELIHIKGIGPQYAEVLVRVDINSVSELAQQDAARLAQRIQNFLEALSVTVVGVSISERRVAGWIKAAAKIAPPPPSRSAAALARVAEEPEAPEEPLLGPTGVVPAASYKGEAQVEECPRCQESFLVAEGVEEGPCPFCDQEIHFHADGPRIAPDAAQPIDDAELAKEARLDASRGFLSRFGKGDAPAVAIPSRGAAAAAAATAGSGRQPLFRRREKDVETEAAREALDLAKKADEDATLALQFKKEAEREHRQAERVREAAEREVKAMRDKAHREAEQMRKAAAKEAEQARADAEKLAAAMRKEAAKKQAKPPAVAPAPPPAEPVPAAPAEAEPDKTLAETAEAPAAAPSAGGLLPPRSLENVECAHCNHAFTVRAAQRKATCPKCHSRLALVADGEGEKADEAARKGAAKLDAKRAREEAKAKEAEERRRRKEEAALAKQEAKAATEAEAAKLQATPGLAEPDAKEFKRQEKQRAKDEAAAAKLAAKEEAARIKAEAAEAKRLAKQAEAPVAEAPAVDEKKAAKEEAARAKLAAKEEAARIKAEAVEAKRVAKQAEAPAVEAPAVDEKKAAKEEAARAKEAAKAAAKEDAARLQQEKAAAKLEAKAKVVPEAAEPAPDQPKGLAARLRGAATKGAPADDAAAETAAEEPESPPTLPVIELEGVGPKYAEKLEAAGVATTGDLLAADAQALAGETGLSDKEIAKWQSMSDLLRVEGVGPQEAEVLVRSGIVSVQDLAGRKPKALSGDIEQLQDRVDVTITDHDVGPARVKQWIKAAKGMPVMLAAPEVEAQPAKGLLARFGKAAAVDASEPADATAEAEPEAKPKRGLLGRKATAPEGEAPADAKPKRSLLGRAKAEESAGEPAEPGPMQPPKPLEEMSEKELAKWEAKVAKVEEKEAKARIKAEETERKRVERAEAARIKAEEKQQAKEVKAASKEAGEPEGKGEASGPTAATDGTDEASGAEEGKLSRSDRKRLADEEKRREKEALEQEKQERERELEAQAKAERRAMLESDSVWEQSLAVPLKKPHQEHGRTAWEDGVDAGTGYESVDDWGAAAAKGRFSKVEQPRVGRLRLTDGSSPFARQPEDAKDARQPPRLRDGRSPFEVLPDDEVPDFARAHAFGHEPGREYTTEAGFHIIEEIIETEAAPEKLHGRSQKRQEAREDARRRKDEAQAKAAERKLKAKERRDREKDEDSSRSRQGLLGLAALRRRGDDSSAETQVDEERGAAAISKLRLPGRRPRSPDTDDATALEQRPATETQDDSQLPDVQADDAPTHPPEEPLAGATAQAAVETAEPAEPEVPEVPGVPGVPDMPEAEAAGPMKALFRRRKDTAGEQAPAELPDEVSPGQGGPKGLLARLRRGAADSDAPQSGGDSESQEQESGVAAKLREKLRRRADAEAVDEAADSPKEPAGEAPRGRRLALGARRRKGVAVIDLEGVGPTYAEKLGEAGVETTTDLLSADAEELAGATGISAKEIGKWQAMCDLMRVDGIGPQYAEALVRSGVLSVADLAEREPEGLAAEVQAYLESLKVTVVGTSVGAGHTQNWIEAARKLEGGLLGRLRRRPKAAGAPDDAHDEPSAAAAAAESKPSLGRLARLRRSKDESGPVEVPLPEELTPEKLEPVIDAEQGRRAREAAEAEARRQEEEAAKAKAEVEEEKRRVLEAKQAERERRQKDKAASAEAAELAKQARLKAKDEARMAKLEAAQRAAEEKERQKKEAAQQREEARAAKAEAAEQARKAREEAAQQRETALAAKAEAAEQARKAREEAAAAAKEERRAKIEAASNAQAEAERVESDAAGLAQAERERLKREAARRRARQEAEESKAAEVAHQELEREKEAARLAKMEAAERARAERDRMKQEAADRRDQEKRAAEQAKEAAREEARLEKERIVQEKADARHQARLAKLEAKHAEAAQGQDTTPAPAPAEVTPVVANDQAKAVAREQRRQQKLMALATKAELAEALRLEREAAKAAKLEEVRLRAEQEAANKAEVAAQKQAEKEARAAEKERLRLERAQAKAEKAASAPEPEPERVPEPAVEQPAPRAVPDAATPPREQPRVVMERVPAPAPRPRPAFDPGAIDRVIREHGIEPPRPRTASPAPAKVDRAVERRVEHRYERRFEGTGRSFEWLDKSAAERRRREP